MGDILFREGDYRQVFPEDINTATRLNGLWSEDDLDAFGTELPMVVLDSLNADLDLAATKRLRTPSPAFLPNKPPADGFPLGTTAWAQEIERSSAVPSFCSGIALGI